MKNMLSNSHRIWHYCLVLFSLWLFVGLPQADAATAHVQAAQPLRQVAGRVQVDGHAAVAKAKKQKFSRLKKLFPKGSKKGKLTWFGILTLVSSFAFFLLVLVTNGLASPWLYYASISISLLLVVFGLIFYKERTGFDTLVFVLVGLFSAYSVLMVNFFSRAED
jgi:hypothetical protein